MATKISRLQQRLIHIRTRIETNPDLAPILRENEISAELAYHLNQENLYWKNKYKQY